jgi:hypothetical protein
MRLRIRALLVGMFFLTSGTVAAQSTQYTLPGEPEERPDSRREEMERLVEGARYRLGPVRIAPWLGLRDAAYVRTLFATGTEPPSDFTATVGAGLRAYLRTGRKVLWSAHALPEYVWWQEQEERRRLNGRYGLGLHGFFNRLSVETILEREEVQRIVTPEIPQPSNVRLQSARLLSEVELTGATFAFATASVSEQTSLADDEEDPRLQALGLLDREDRAARIGVRWRPREAWMLGLGIERTEADFADAALDRSNSGTAPILEFKYDRRRFLAQADLAVRSLEAREGARFLAFDGVTGTAAVSLRPGGLQAWLYGNRDILYSLSPGYAYLTDERLGVALSVRLGRRTQVRSFAETGTDEYTAFSPAEPRRSDDVVSFGGGLTIALWGPVSLEVQAVRSEFDSNLPGGDRTYTAAGATLNLLGGR